jgi:Flp pilus assembly protein TadG
MTVDTPECSPSAPRRDRGSLLVPLCLLVVITLAGAALIVDGGRVLVTRRDLAATAQAAARAGVGPASLAAGFDPARARALALDHAVRSGVAADRVDVRVERTADGRPRVIVTIDGHLDTVFLVLGGAERLHVRASGAAIAVYDT